MGYQRVREDYRMYPTMASESGMYICASGYFYAKTTAKNGSRDVYARLDIVQTYPNELPLNSQDARILLQNEAREILTKLESGELKVGLYGRFKRCGYDHKGQFLGRTEAPHVKSEHPYAPNVHPNI